jgi:hypothetical protein
MSSRRSRRERATTGTTTMTRATTIETAVGRGAPAPPPSERHSSRSRALAPSAVVPLDERRELPVIPLDRPSVTGGPGSASYPWRSFRSEPFRACRRRSAAATYGLDAVVSGDRRERLLRTRRDRVRTQSPGARSPRRSASQRLVGQGARRSSDASVLSAPGGAPAPCAKRSVLAATPASARLCRLVDDFHGATGTCARCRASARCRC